MRSSLGFATERRRLAGLLLAAVFAVATPTAALAVDRQKAVSFVETVSSNLLNLLRAKPLAERPDAFRGLVSQHVATSDVARVVMGASWRRMNPAQQSAYTEALIDYIAYSYVSQFAQFSDETLEILDAQDRGRRGAFVQSLLRNDSGAIEVIWRVTDRNGDEQLIDLYLEGVSLIVTQQSDIAVLLERNNGDFDRLIEDLRARAASAYAAAVSEV